jgi:AcrR family transcriptional regulator
MGNREDLIAGAKKCLYEKGYRHTSARDIATAAGTSLAAIGYHFGGKANLLNIALVDAAKEWGDEMERTLAPDQDLPPAERFTATWSRVIESFTTHREMWMSQFRLLPDLKELPDGGEFLTKALREGRRELAAIFQPVAGDHEKRVVGSVYHALLLGMMAQWLTDPDDALSAAELVEGLSAITGVVQRS